MSDIEHIDCPTCDYYDAEDGECLGCGMPVWSCDDECIAAGPNGEEK